MRPIPEITDLDQAFGSIDHLPPYKDIPNEFKNMNNRYLKFVSKWFFSGLSEADLSRLSPREGVDAKKALRAIGAALRSFGPAHVHKESGCAYLLDQWFDLSPKSCQK